MGSLRLIPAQVVQWRHALLVVLRHPVAERWRRLRVRADGRWEGVGGRVGHGGQLVIRTRNRRARYCGRCWPVIIRDQRPALRRVDPEGLTPIMREGLPFDRLLTCIRTLLRHTVGTRRYIGRVLGLQWNSRRLVFGFLPARASLWRVAGAYKSALDAILTCCRSAINSLETTKV